MFEFLKRGVVVSCQATEEEPMHGSEIMAKMAKAAKEGGAVGIRANTPEDVRAVKAAVDIPIIGIFKDKVGDSEVYITPTADHVERIIEAGADIIALDCTRRDRPQRIAEIFGHIRKKHRIPIMADIASLDDAMWIAKLKPDIVATTLSGYTDYTANRPTPDIELIREIRERIDIPVIAEGNYTQPEQVFEALAAGAYAVVVGGAITRPQQTTKRFTDAVGCLVEGKKAIGIDLGGTRVRGAIVDSSGGIVERVESMTDIDSPLESVMETVGKLAGNGFSAIGVGSAGRIDFESGKVLYATENLRNWTEKNLRPILERKYSVPVTVDNDVNAAAYAHWFGSGGSLKDFAYVAVGTGLGGGLVVDGRLRRGKRGNAGEFGHITVPGNGRICTCGKTGCLETVLSGRFIRGEYEKRFGDFSWENFLELLASDDGWASSVAGTMASHAAWLVDALFGSFDLQKVLFGGIVEDFGDLFISKVRESLGKYLVNGLYDPSIVGISGLGKSATVIGAALEALRFGERGRHENE